MIDFNLAITVFVSTSVACIVEYVVWVVETLFLSFTLIQCLFSPMYMYFTGVWNEACKWNTTFGCYFYL